MIGDLNWGDRSLVFCSEAKAPYIVIQTAPGERQRRSRRRMEPGCRSIVTAEERAGVLAELRMGGESAESEHTSFADPKEG